MNASKYLALAALSLMMASPALAEAPQPAADQAPAVHFVSVKGKNTDKNYKNDGAKAEGAVAIGKGASATKTDDIAIGTNAKAAGGWSLAIGSGSVAEGQVTEAIGYESSAKGSYTAALFGGKVEGGQINYALGYGATVASTANKAMALGSNAKASAESTVAIGLMAQATGYQALAMGAGANATASNASAYGTLAKATANGGAAFGHSTKAFGGKSTALGYMAQAKADQGISIGALTMAGSTNSIAIGTQANVADDADNSNAFGVQASALSKNALALGSFSQVAKDSEFGVALGTSAKVLGGKSLALGHNSIAQAANSVALGDKSIVAGLVDGKAYLTDEAYKATQGAIAVGHPDHTATIDCADQKVEKNHRRVMYVAGGIDDADAVNVAQLKKAVEKAQADLAAVTGLSNDDVKALTGDKEGAAKPKTLVERINDAANKPADGKVAAGDKGLVSGDEVYKAIEKAKADLGTGTGGGKADSVNAKDKDGNATTVTGSGVNAKDKNGNETCVTGAGVNAKDTNGNSTSVTGAGVNAKDTNGNSTSVTGAGVNAKDKQGNETTLTGAGLNAKDKDGNNTAVNGKGVTVKTPDGTATLSGKDLVFAGKDGKDGSATYGRDGLTISGPAGADGEPGKTIVINADKVDMGGNRVQNVADGVEPTDAVNKGQLDALRDELSSGKLSSAAVKRLEKKSSRGDAMGAALAALKPLDFNPLKPHQFMAGYGNYSGTSAIALGFGTYNETGDRFLHAGLAYGGNSDLSFNAGVSFQFGSDEDEKGTKVVTTNNLSAMNQQMQQLKAENEELKRQVKLLMDKAGLN